MRPLTYLTFDSLEEGVGASQVLEYVLKIAQNGRKVTIVSFEKNSPSEDIQKILSELEIHWTPLPFGKFGSLGGIYRVIRMSKEISKHSIVHARGNLSALAVLMSRNRRWIWDCRSMHADQRRSLSKKKNNYLIHRAMLAFEYVIARQSKKIIVITFAVIPIFKERYRINQTKMVNISTCVNLDKFSLQDLPALDIIQVLLSGTFSPAYDLELINKIIAEMRRITKVHVTVAASSGATESWKSVNYDSYVSVSHNEMPNLVAKSHVGFSIWNNQLGICLKSVASTKTAEFLATGRPVFVNSQQGDFKEIFSKCDLGVVTDSNDDKSVKKYVQEILLLLVDREMPTRCRNLAEEYFSLDKGVMHLIEIYSELDLV